MSRCFLFSLLFMPCSNKGMEHLYSMKCKNKVPLYDLLLEMLDAHRVHRPDRPADSWSQEDREPPPTTTNNNNSCGGSGSSLAGSSSGPRVSHESPSRGPTCPGVLQYGGSRSECTHILWDRAQQATSEGQKSFHGWCARHIIPRLYLNSFHEIIIYKLSDFIVSSCLGRHFSFALLQFTTIWALMQFILYAAFLNICDFESVSNSFTVHLIISKMAGVM